MFPFFTTKDKLLPFDHPSKLHVISVFFNFQRFKKPVENFFIFKKHIESLGVTFHVVEIVLGNSSFQVTDYYNPNHMQLRTNTEFFQKENLINLAVSSAKNRYPDLEYFAWIDGDIHFFNHNIIQETIYRLQRYPVVQMWSRALDLGFNGEPLEFAVATGGKNGIIYSMSYCYNNGIERDPKQTGYRWHPGYAWAMTYDCWDKLGGLYDHAIVGAGDHHMSMAFINRPFDGIRPEVTDEYKNDYFEWASRAKQVVNGRIGYVPGMIHHSWHGKKMNRKYVERWNILIDNKYDPALDLVKDEKGQLYLSGRNPKLQEQIIKYFETRDDDANR